MQTIVVALVTELSDRKPAHALIGEVHLVIVAFDGAVSVFYGRCLHSGALLADGWVEGSDLISPLHSGRYRLESGASGQDNIATLPKFTAWIENGHVCVDGDEVAQWAETHPQPLCRDESLGTDGDAGHNSFVQAKGVSPEHVPSWGDIQILTAQLYDTPLRDGHPVGTDVVIGPRAKRPLHLAIPLIVSEMSFGLLSTPARQALALGAEWAGTGFCPAEGGVRPEEHRANSRYFYQLASASFGFSWDEVMSSQAFHFTGGPGARRGSGSCLRGSKVSAPAAVMRGHPVDEPATFPAWFPDWNKLRQTRDFAEEVRERSGGIPIGYRLSAQHIEKDIDAAIEVGVDYILLDGYGGVNAAASTNLRDSISVPTIPALARARHHLDRTGQHDVTLIITGGLRTPTDFVKAMALGANAVGVSGTALQASGCTAMCACYTSSRPVGMCSEQSQLAAQRAVYPSAQQLARFLKTSVYQMQMLARACAHDHLTGFNFDDLSTWSRAMAELSDVPYCGFE